MGLPIQWSYLSWFAFKQFDAFVPLVNIVGVLSQ